MQMDNFDLDDKRTKIGIDYVGKVIRILDEYSLIVDAGYDILQEGDSVQVYIQGETIYSLDMEDLGSLDYIKEELIVDRVEPYFSICKKELRKVYSVTGNFRLIASQFSASPMISNKRDPMKINADELSPLKDITSAKTVRLGDLVRLKPHKK